MVTADKRMVKGIMSHMGALREAYNAIRAVVDPEYLEPFADVEQVNGWRQHYRPKRVRLLIIAESHVRRKSGPGFIYDSSYYTPWWSDLLRPAFGHQATRKEELCALQDRGVWILDASVIALAGYKNIDSSWPNRPLDPVANRILEFSWRHFVQREFERSNAEHFVYFERAALMLPGEVTNYGTSLKFRTPSNSARYRNPDYKYGTARFVDAVRAAGLGNALTYAPALQTK